MGSQVLVPFRGSEDSHRHLKLMGDLGQVKWNMTFYSQAPSTTTHALSLSLSRSLTLTKHTQK